MSGALGLRVFALDIVLYVMVTIAIVIAVQIIGNILVLALLLTPAATARLLTDRLGLMMPRRASVIENDSTVAAVVVGSYLKRISLS